MKRASVMTQRRKRVARAIQHLEDNIEKDITLQELAEIACLSRFHFARTFVELVGYSPMMLVRRLRLLEAADRLREGRTTIAAAADYAGYASATAFSRACRRVLGRTPGQLMQGEEISDPDEQIDVVELGEMRSGGFRYSGAHREVCDAYDPLARAALSVGDWQPRFGAFALVYEGEPVGGHADNWLDADVAVPVLSPVPSLAGFDPMAMPAGRYAVLKQRINDRKALARLNDLVERIVAESGSAELSSPVIRWHRYDPALRPQAMQCWWLLVPLGDVPAEFARAR